MTDVVLVNVLQHDFHQGIFNLGNSRKNQPLDLAQIAAVLEQIGLKSLIIDANLLRILHKDVALKICSEKPKMVIINTAALDRWECPLPTVKEPKILAHLIKKQYPKCLLVAIGPHGTVAPEWVLEKCKVVDILIRGEPELTIGEIGQKLSTIKNAKNKILGISYFKNGVVINNPPRPYLENLDLLPLPAYHLLPMSLYGPMSDHFNGGKFEGEITPFSIMLTSRGCPGLCTFCFKKMYQDKKTYRYASPKRVVKEIELLLKKFGVKAIYFQDLSFCIEPKRVEQICREITLEKLKFSWGCEARFDSVSLPLLLKMKKAGCSFINFGLESGSQKILNLCQKNIPLSIIKKAITDCQEAKIAAGCFKLTGLPGETRETFIETLEFMLRNKIEIPYPFPLVLPLPYPGTKLHQLAEKQFQKNIDWENAPKFAGRIGTNFLEKTTLAEIQRLVYLYKLKQENKKITRHYFKLLLLEKLGKLNLSPSKLFISENSRLFSRRHIVPK